MPKGREARAARAMRAREPKLVENDRNLLGLRGPSSSALGVSVLRDLLSLKNPHTRMLGRKNDIRPLEDASSLEFLCERNDCSAFAYTSSSKKRPHNVILGRLFDGHVLDMFELGTNDFADMTMFRGPKKRLGSAPAFIFQGDAWTRDVVLARLQNTILDVWGSRNMTHLSLEGLDHVIVLSAVEDAAAGAAAGGDGSAAFRGALHWRTYTLAFSNAGGPTPKVDLSSMGPSIDFTLRRFQLASDSLYKSARQQPAQVTAKRPKNVSMDELGVTHGRVHMESQDFLGLQLKKSKAVRAELRAAKRAKAGAGTGAVAGAIEEGSEVHDVEGVGAILDDDEDETQAPTKRKTARRE